LERKRSRDVVNAANAKAKKEILSSSTTKIGALGSGSDYTPFFQHLGIPSLDIGFGGENPGGEYHSVYDSYDHYKRFKDPSFDYGIALAKTAGRATLRIANADLLPFEFKGFYRTVNGYTQEVIALLESARETTEVENQLVSEKRYTLAADPTKKYIPPVKKDEVPYLNFAPLQNALEQLEKAANEFGALQKAGAKSPQTTQQVNQLLFQAEQKLLSKDGLPRRPWYRHSIYAPGFYTGYGVKTLPGIREAIEQRNWKEAQEQIEIAAQTLTDYAATVNSINSLMAK
jgi:N-acetylated-alpha-linked acidic dipeptidase